MKSHLVYGVLAGILALGFFQSVSADTGNHEGFYAGLGLGSQQNSYNWSTTDYLAPNGTPLSLTGSSNTHEKNNALLTDAFLGYQWLVAPQVLTSVEAHISQADNDAPRGSVSGINESSPVAAGYSYTEAETDWSASVRGRIGYLIRPTVQVYATAGIATTELDTSITCPADTNVCNPAFGNVKASSSDTLVGWLAGVGFETAFTDHLNLRVEYVYTDYDDSGSVALPVSSGKSFGVAGDTDLSSNAATVGVTYRF